MMYYRTDVRLTSSLQIFFLRVLKWRNVLRIDDVLRDWAKDKARKRLAEALNRFEKQEEER